MRLSTILCAALSALGGRESFAFSLLSHQESRILNAHVRTSSLSSLSSLSSSTALWATKKKSKKKQVATASSTGGGFGRASFEKPQKSSNDDYSMFPALEQGVTDTLVASPPELLEPGELPIEIYDRLDQIYGFKDFNYLTKDSNEGSVDDTSRVEKSPKMTFDDLLTSGASSSSPVSMVDDFLSSKAPSADISELLSSVTGGSSDTSEPLKSVEQDSSKIDAISSLPPFDQFRILHIDPLILAVDDFFTPEECDCYVEMTLTPEKGSSDAPLQSRSMTVGKDAQAKAQRTSTTWFHHYKAVPELMSKASRLLGLDDIDCWEEPQTVRYRRNEHFTWHLDALSPNESSPESGGQRTATLLVYHTDLSEDDGGATMFRDLGIDDPLKVRPKKGLALLFFPAAGGIPNSPFDIRTLHSGQAVSDTTSQDKWISQLWLRQSRYTPTAPPNNSHEAATGAITDYCSSA